MNRSLLSLAAIAASSGAAVYLYRTKDHYTGFNSTHLSLAPSPLGVESYCRENTPALEPLNAPGQGASPTSLISRTTTIPLHGVSDSIDSTERIRRAIYKSRRTVRRVMLEQGIPGAVLAVSRDGEVVWSEGLGLADVENDVPCTPESVMRIASISKSLAAVGLLRLYQRNMVDLDTPIQTYVPEYPKKTFEGEEVVVTVRMLLSHLGGVRHYSKSLELEKEMKEFDNKEYYIKDHYNSIKEAIKLFSEDDLVSKPGSKFHYTTHGWTLISRVIEKVSKQSFLQYMEDNVCRPLDMKTTKPEYHEEIMYGRAKHYVRDLSKNGYLRNTPFVDLSYKWAGGGFISNAEDLVKFGNSILSSWQSSRTPHSSSNLTILTHGTTAMMLAPAIEDISSTEKERKIHDLPTGYGMGWFVRQGKKGLMGVKDYPCVFSHTGGAVGASSVLTIVPTHHDDNETVANSDGSPVDRSYAGDHRASVTRPKGVDGSPVDCSSAGDHRASVTRPKGVVVAVIFNLQGVKKVFNLGVEIAEEFHY